MIHFVVDRLPTLQRTMNHTPIKIKHSQNTAFFKFIRLEKGIIQIKSNIKDTRLVLLNELFSSLFVECLDVEFSK